MTRFETSLSYFLTFQRSKKNEPTWNSLYKKNCILSSFSFFQNSQRQKNTANCQPWPNRPVVFRNRRKMPNQAWIPTPVGVPSQKLQYQGDTKQQFLKDFLRLVHVIRAFANVSLSSENHHVSTKNAKNIKHGHRSSF